MDLKAYLGEIGWSKANLARKLSVHPNTVTQWGKSLPKYVRAYLDLRVGLKRLLDG